MPKFKSKYKKPAPSIAEEKDGSRQIKTASGKELIQNVETKKGVDGIVETHVSYSPAILPTARQKWGRPTSTYCLECRGWYNPREEHQCKKKMIRNLDMRLKKLEPRPVAGAALAPVVKTKKRIYQ